MIRIDLLPRFLILLLCLIPKEKSVCLSFSFDEITDLQDNTNSIMGNTIAQLFNSIATLLPFKHILYEKNF
jgi:hypothetical protein